MLVLSIVLLSVGIPILLILALKSRRYIVGEWKMAEPDEILLVIKDGDLKRSGVGIRYHSWPWSGKTIVKFSTTLQRVSFSANNITKEKQGVEISGFVLWRVDQVPTNAFKCFKTLGLKNLFAEKRLSREDSHRVMGKPQYRATRELVEAVVRNYIANTTIEDLLSKREVVRTALIKDLTDIMGGWGAVVDNAELNHVKVLSVSVFSNLQVEYREELRLLAETTHDEAQAKLDQTRVYRETQKQKEKEMAVRDRAIAKTRLQLETEEENAKLMEAQTKMKRLQVEQKTEQTLFEIASSAQLDEKRAAARLEEQRREAERSRFRVESSLVNKEMELRFEESKSNAVIQREMMNKAMDTAARVFTSMKVGDVKWYNFGGGGSGTSSEPMSLFNGFLDRFVDAGRRLLDPTSCLVSTASGAAAAADGESTTTATTTSGDAAHIHIE